MNKQTIDTKTIEKLQETAYRLKIRNEALVKFKAKFPNGIKIKDAVFLK